MCLTNELWKLSNGLWIVYYLAHVYPWTYTVFLLITIDPCCIDEPNAPWSELGSGVKTGIKFPKHKMKKCKALRYWYVTLGVIKTCGTKHLMQGYHRTLCKMYAQFQTSMTHCTLLDWWILKHTISIYLCSLCKLYNKNDHSSKQFTFARCCQNI